MNKIRVLLIGLLIGLGAAGSLVMVMQNGTSPQPKIVKIAGEPTPTPTPSGGAGGCGFSGC